MQPEERVGAVYLGDRVTSFLLWAPRVERVEVCLGSDSGRTHAMEPAPYGYHRAVVEGAGPGDRYLFRLDGTVERPDPASRSQPDGVHGPSEIVDHAAFAWSDAGWAGIPLRRYVTYEVHMGTFTPEGTFDAAVGRLDELVDLGVTALEIMPVAAFPGSRNWGYDGVYPYAVQASYGGMHGLKRLVDECHRREMAVVLDVVYNHLGPEGNYLDDYGPYFTNKYHTPWGRALNHDGAGSDDVRRFFIGSALSWFEDFHIDALRLDAIHGILDMSARPFLQELGAKTREASNRLGRTLALIAESDLNDVRVLNPASEGGLGMDAQWSDDFHHAVHAALTGERNGYYCDFGSPGHVVTALNRGYVLAGEYSQFRRRRHGNSAASIEPERFVVFVQNHDQVGNRLRGERLSTLVGFEELKLAAGLLLLSPYMPLLFMGEEYGETAPFQYFVSHSDPALIEAVREGRRQEFAALSGAGEGPDPQDDATFLRSKLEAGWAHEGRRRTLRELYRELIGLRTSLGLPAPRSRVEARAERDRVLLRLSSGERDALAIFNLGESSCEVPPEGQGWDLRLDSSDLGWGGPGSRWPVEVAPRSLMLLLAADAG
ncbi:MAG: malto-oligosyltrehalose trehalohydrolase [Actinomycetota bacterium]